MTGIEQYAQLEIIRNKGNCVATLWRAHKALNDLSPFIPDLYEREIRLALHHVESEGPDELNSALKRIMAQYQR